MRNTVKPTDQYFLLMSKNSSGHVSQLTEIGSRTPGLIVAASQADSLAEIRIYRPIGAGIENGLSGAALAEEITYLATAYKNILIRINSYGGSVLDGMSIGAAITAARETHKTYFTVQIDGVAASIAYVLAIFADRIKGVDYGLVMTHKTRYLNGDGDQDVLDKFNDSIAEIFRKRLKSSDRDINYFFSDSDRWFSMDEAFQFGLVDEVIETEAKEIVDKAKELVSVGALDQIVNFFSNNNQKSKMDQEILNALSLPASATPKEIVNAISALRSEVIAKETVIEGLRTEVANKGAEIETLQGKISAFEAAEQARKQKEAKEVVNQAVKEKKIKQDAAEKWEKLYMENPELAKETLNSLSSNPKLSEITKDDETPAFKGLSIANVMSEIDAKIKNQKV